MKTIVIMISPKDIRHIPVSELTDEQWTARLTPTWEALKQRTFANNSYLTYYDPNVCPTNEYMVNEFQDRKELVKLDSDGGGHFVKLLY